MRRAPPVLTHQHIQVVWKDGTAPLTCEPDVCSFLALSKSLDAGQSSSQFLQYSDLCSEMLSAQHMVGRGRHA